MRPASFAVIGLFDILGSLCYYRGQLNTGTDEIPHRERWRDRPSETSATRRQFTGQPWCQLRQTRGGIWKMRVFERN